MHRLLDVMYPIAKDLDLTTSFVLMAANALIDDPAAQAG